MQKGLFSEKKKAVIYCRVSTEEQAKEGESLANQERRCNEFADKNGYEVVEKFIEEGESGRSINRTELQKLLAFCSDKRNSIVAVICLKEDRFARNVADAIMAEHLLEKVKVALLFVSGNNERTASGKFVREVNHAIAEFESNVNSERTIAGLSEALSQGRWTRRLRGYSFRSNVEGKRQLFPNEDAPHIKKIFDLAEKGVYSQDEIRRRMEREGFKISKQALSVLLRNIVYCGLLPDKYNKNNGKYIKGIHEPLITEEQYFKVQAILNDRRPNAVPRKRNNPNYPLRGYVYCWDCNAKMTASRAKGHTKYFYYYHCKKPHCNASRVQKNVLESAFRTYLQTIKIHPRVIDLFEKCVVSKFEEKMHDVIWQRKHIEREIQKLEKHKSDLINLLLRKVLEEEDMKKEMDKIKAQINEQQIMLQELANGPDVQSCWNFAKNVLLHLDDAWEKGDLNFRQRLQGLIVPAGFTFKENLVKPIKNPCFLSIFQHKTGENVNMGWMTRFEPATSGSTDRRSNQLSYIHHKSLFLF